MTTVKVTSSDDVEFVVPKDVISFSQTVKHMIDDLPDVAAEYAIPIASVKANTLKKVIEWCEYHTKNPDTPIPETDRYRTDNIIPWDQDFMKVEMSLLFDLTLAANYLDIKLLLDLCLKTIANLMKGKTAEEIKTLFATPDGK